MIVEHFGAAPAAMLSSCSGLRRRERKLKAKLSMEKVRVCSDPHSDHELRIWTERMSLQLQAAEMSFLRRPAELSLKDGID